MGTGKFKRSWADERTQGEHERALNELNNNVKYSSSGVFELTNLRLVSHNGGYQVIFWNPEETYTPSQYANVMNDFMRYSYLHRAEATKEDGEARISFLIPNKRDALRLARRYNQSSVWDWANGRALSTERRLRRGI